MSEGLNKVLLIGNLCADPELRFTQGGQPVLNMRLATTESYVDKDKVRKERTEYINLVLWGKRGEALGKILTKGSRIHVEGGLHTSSYDNREGVKVYKTEVNVTNVILLGGKGQAPEGGGEGGHEGGGERQQGGGYARGNGGGQRSQGRQQQAPQNEPPADDFDAGGGDDGSDLPF